MNPFMKVLRNLAWLTQLGVSLIAPLILCIGVCFWLQHRFSLGPWIMVLGILLGMGAALSSAFRFSQVVMRQAKKDEKNTLYVQEPQASKQNSQEES